MPGIPPYLLYPSGDHALTVDLGPLIDARLNRWVIAAFQYLRAHPVIGVKDIIPAYSTVTLVYDPVVIKKSTGTPSAFAFMEAAVAQALEAVTVTDSETINHVDIPVCYDPLLGPDLAFLASLHQLSIDEIVELHSSTTYQVYMIGFLPGFAYMGSVAKRIATPRLSQPRANVPAGSVGIAGEQTGIYPLASPGGWQLIGQTPLSLFDAGSEQPCLLQPGDEVQFYPVSLAEFKKMKSP